MKAGGVDSAIRVRGSELWLCSRIKFFSYMWPLVLRNVEHIHHLLFFVFHLGHRVMSAGPLFISLFDFVIVKHVTVGR